MSKKPSRVDHTWRIKDLSTPSPFIPVPFPYHSQLSSLPTAPRLVLPDPREFGCHTLCTELSAPPPRRLWFHRRACLFACYQDYSETTQPIFTINSIERWIKEETVRFRWQSESGNFWRNFTTALLTMAKAPRGFGNSPKIRRLAVLKTERIKGCMS